MEKVRPLEWDTDFFGYSIGEISNFERNNLIHLLNQSKGKYKLLILKTDPLDFESNDECVSNKGILIDEKLTFLKMNASQEFCENEASLYQKNLVTEDLVLLSKQSGEYSRFKLDKNFENNEFEKLYEKWIENSINKEIAKETIIIEAESKIVGVLTLGIKNQRADIGILAIDEKHRGKGFGFQLVEKAFCEMKNLDMKDIQVVTQKANINACNFYRKMGFTLEKQEYVYHFWL